MNAYNNLLFKAGFSFLLISFLMYVSCFGNVASPPPPPINDECFNAIPITVDTICNYTTYTNIDATASFGVPAPGCAPYMGGDVWFSVVVPTSGHLIFDSQNQGIGSSGMAIYSGNCGSLALINCNANGNINSMPRINQAGLIPGSTIYIRFWKNNSTGGGLFDLCVYDPPIPINDNCLGAISILPDSSCIYTLYNNQGATSSANLPAPPCANYLGGDVWFKVVVPATGHLVFDSQNSMGIINGSGGMALYSGNCNSLILIACDTNSSSNTVM